MNEIVMFNVCLCCDWVIKQDGKCLGFMLIVLIVFMCGLVGR